MQQRFDETQAADAADAIRNLVQTAGSVSAFTGAGVSTESGVPDFRSPGGVWSRSRIIEYAEYLSSAPARQEYWIQKTAQCAEFAKAGPNVTHRVLAAWERELPMPGVITQNIDGLHQQAGSRQVLELHGSARRVACLDCDWQDAADRWNQQFLDTGDVPDCPACGGLIKHATVSFGQTLPAAVLRASMEQAERCDVFLTLGSSLVVEPAASLPRMAAAGGGRLVIVNRDPTPLDSIATLVARMPLGLLFRQLETAAESATAADSARRPVGSPRTGGGETPGPGSIASRPAEWNQRGRATDRRGQ